MCDSAATPASAEATAGAVLRTAVFFSSYAYAEAIASELADRRPDRAAVQPRRVELSARAAWVEECFVQTDVIFLILGSSFAESIDLLGGRVGRAMVVGPALPEVSPVQQARQEQLAGLGQEAAFSRVYQVPGTQKVNQALGWLVRAPGQRARVLLHCRRFAEPGYNSLLLSATGTGILVSAIIAGLVMGFTPLGMLRRWLGTVVHVRLSLLTIASMMAISFVTRNTPALTPRSASRSQRRAGYPFFGTLLGWLGVALTGSDTSSNVLFPARCKPSPQLKSASVPRLWPPRTRPAA